MTKSAKKRARTADDDVVDAPDGKPVVKKSKLDSTGEAKVTKRSTKVKEPKNESVAAGKPPKSKKEKKDKMAKKSKSKAAEPAPEVEEEPAPAPSDSQPANGEAAATADASSADKQTSAKKKKKKDKKKKQAQTVPTESQPQPDAPIEEEPTTTSVTNGDSTSGKPARFIVFVGNLPFSATADAVRAHFASLHPTSVRLLTQRDDPTKSRGIAFVEFGRYDHMKTCLEKFHHSEFDDGTGAPRRRINVELTYVIFCLKAPFHFP
jgi:nucleolar protein 6